MINIHVKQWSVRIASQQTTFNIKDQWSVRIASQQTTSNIKDQWSLRIASQHPILKIIVVYLPSKYCGSYSS